MRGWLVAALIGWACSPAVSPATPPAQQTEQAAEEAPSSATAQRVAASAAHVAAVENAVRAAYAIRSATNGCPFVESDLHGWPAARVRHCVYQQNDSGLGRPRVAVVYLLDVQPGEIARWIETACALVPADAEQCFARVLEEGRGNSGYMFPVAGNMIENMGGGRNFKNYIFRNGMTTSFRRHVNGGAEELSLEDQEALAAAADAAAIAVPTGLTRFWRTLPADFAERFPGVGAPANVSTPANRAAWLDLARTEMLAALDSDRNRLLEAWLCAHAVEKFGAPCADV